LRSFLFAAELDIVSQPMTKRFLAFEVSLNGERLCVAGLPDARVLVTALSWSSPRQPTRFKKGTVLEGLYFHVGALTESKSGARAHPNWVAHPKLKVGDEISVRVVGVAVADPPAREQLLSREEAREQEYKSYLRLKRRFGHSKSKRRIRPRDPGRPG
jgi:hypothetical protein